MTYKIITFPKDRIIEDLGIGIVYLTTEDQDFMQKLEHIDNHLIMISFLDINTDKYKELTKPIDNYDKLIDISKSFIELAEVGSCEFYEQIDEMVKDIPLCLMNKGFVTDCDEVAPGETILIKKHKGYIVEYILTGDKDFPDIEERRIRELTKEEYDTVMEQYKS